uniref:Uncharacterized protein n=1 Tax=Arundo donax TaxID=35708 RepID=A0A0A9ABT8_ARUDO
MALKSKPSISKPYNKQTLMANGSNKSTNNSLRVE